MVWECSYLNHRMSHGCFDTYNVHDRIIYSIKECPERYGLAYSTIGNECRRLIPVDIEEFVGWTMKFYLEREIETLHDLIFIA